MFFLFLFQNVTKVFFADSVSVIDNWEIYEQQCAVSAFFESTFLSGLWELSLGAEGYFLVLVLDNIFPGVAISRYPGQWEPTSCHFGSPESTHCAPDILPYCQLATAPIECWYIYWPFRHGCIPKWGNPFSRGLPGLLPADSAARSAAPGITK